MPILKRDYFKKEQSQFNNLAFYIKKLEKKRKLNLKQAEEKKQ